MTKLNLDKLQALADAATPGLLEWWSDPLDDDRGDVGYLDKGGVVSNLTDGVRTDGGYNSPWLVLKSLGWPVEVE